jgi:spermidine synthase
MGVMMSKPQRDHSSKSDLVEWQQANLDAILKRLRPLRSEPDGIIHQEVTAFHDLIIEKSGSRINLVFDTSNPERFSIESRIDIYQPLKLLATYTQIMMLSLVWTPQPERVYVIGLGGGRMPMVFHHYFPNVIIESTEIDPILPEIAQRYFGLALDNRNQVIIQDGRRFLEERRSNRLDKLYDIILVDAFFEALYTPYQLATHNFLELCKLNLNKAGVLMVNLIASDPLFGAKIETLRASFTNVYLCSYTGGDTVVVGTNADQLSNQEIVARARGLQQRHHFSFPLIKYAKEMAPYSQSTLKPSGLENSDEILQDASPPGNLFKGLTRHHTLFRNLSGDDPCPCGSGRKMKNCHLPKL